MIMNTANGMAYIGSTINAARRLRTHYRKLKHGTHKNAALQKDFNVYGERNFTTIILASNIPENDLHVYERSEIAAQQYNGVGVYNVGRARRVTYEQRTQRRMLKRMPKYAFSGTLY